MISSRVLASSSARGPRHRNDALPPSTPTRQPCDLRHTRNSGSSRTLCPGPGVATTNSVRQHGSPCPSLFKGAEIRTLFGAPSPLSSRRLRSWRQLRDTGDDRFPQRPPQGTEPEPDHETGASAPHPLGWSATSSTPWLSSFRGTRSSISRGGAVPRPGCRARSTAGRGALAVFLALTRPSKRGSKPVSAAAVAPRAAAGRAPSAAARRAGSAARSWSWCSRPAGRRARAEPTRCAAGSSGGS